MEILSIAGIILAAAMLSVILKEYKKEYSVLIGLCLAVGVFLLLMPYITMIFRTIESFVSANHEVATRMIPVLKSLGIALVTQMVSDTCRDAGENAMASKMELAGKVTIIIVALPLAQELLDIITGLLK